VDLEERKEEIFTAAIEFEDGAERNAFLTQACGGNRELLEKVRGLLHHHDGTSFLDVSPLGAVIDVEIATLTEGPGAVIGRYKLLEKIGEGGMAVVYMAEQTEPLRRKVALKIIKLGMDTRQVIARFEAERQALALMDHPSIARVLDAGATETGRPYFVMELVQGVSITEYCDKNSLCTKDRLHLFLQVCQAVQHAHQKGIIHRDIKPSNVMVTHHDGKPVPKVIDFGIAKATNQRLTEKTLFTRYAHLIGTPAYMSPEQAELSDLDIDTRSDIYSLGVLLYELLTGTTPFSEEELRKAGYVEMQRVIREQEPVKPSTRIRTATRERRSVGAGPRVCPMSGGHRGPPLQNANREIGVPGGPAYQQVRGDLDWIVMKTLEKDRAKRYETASGLALDIERHLSNEPVVARPPSTAYRARKFIRRNRVVVTEATLLVCLAALSAAGAFLWLRQTRVQWAKNQAVPAVERLTEQAGQVWDYSIFRQALEIGQRAARYLPNDPQLKKALDACSRFWSIQSDPPGAQVSIKPYDDPNASWNSLGHTPIQNVRFGRGFFVVRLEKTGYATVETVGGATLGGGDISRKLDPTNTIPPGMIHVPGRNVAKLGEVPGFFIDKYEVTNHRFKEFVDAGGYQNSRYWKQPFVRDGKVLAWEEAMSLFRDSTDRPGPATWVSGDHPAGRADYPVSGVSWYEAAAYAEFAGKSLPTKDHWAVAAGFDLSECQWHFPTLITAFSNFHVHGPAPVGSHKGMSRFGALDMAGNVREWCWNESPSGRFIRGGAWDSAEYLYSLESQQSAWDRSPQNGFRCVIYPDRDKIPARFFEPNVGSVRDFAKEKEKRVNDEIFEIYKAKFQYDPTELKANVEEHDESAAGWIRERVTFDAAYDGERMIAQIYLPRKGRKPYQSVLFIGGPVLGATRGLMERMLVGGQHLDCALKSGRAVVFPVIKGTYERTGEMTAAMLSPTEENRHAYTEYLVKWVKDFRRCVDYLETRPDFDGQRIAFGCASWSGVLGMIVPAVEPRVRANIILISGLPDNHALPEAHPLNYISRIKVPTLMLNGEYDMFFPVETSVKPAFDLLGTPKEDKRLVVYPTDHYIPVSEGIQEMLAWLDKYFGPAK
jgi:serine/threonine protein kinase/pimeloyl-ACP methyl ester carboxylesterase